MRLASGLGLPAHTCAQATEHTCVAAHRPECTSQKISTVVCIYGVPWNNLAYAYTVGKGKKSGELILLSP